MKKFIISSLTVLAFVFSSCEREDLSEIKPGILDKIESDPELSILNQAIEKAGLKSTLASTQYTFYAPVNEAFDGVDLNSIDAATLLDILKFHISPTRYDSSRFNAEYGLFFGNPASANLVGLTTLNTKFGANVFFTNSSRFLNGVLEKDGVWVSGVQILELDAHEASDGVVHKIEGLLTPPAGLSGETIDANPNLSLFAALCKKAATAPGAATFFASILNNPSEVNTVLAPTNAAMTAAALTQTDIDLLTPAQCLALARAQVLNRTQAGGFTTFRRFASDFVKLYKDNGSVNAAPYATYQAGRTVTFNGANATFTGALNANVTINKANIITGNGVIHIVDAVINN